MSFFRAVSAASRRMVGIIYRYRRLLASGIGSAEVAAAPSSLIEALRLSARRPGNAKTVVSLLHAIDRFRRPRSESVMTGAELAAISTSTIFILGSDDPYLSPQRARPSIDQFQNATLYEVPGENISFGRGLAQRAHISNSDAKSAEQATTRST